ncbi:MAG: anti-sigma factor antagonist [Candidatus Electrothrix sp. AR3]|nr:anti-sigma factor antagonist [Candidatus Electrothrix sp. AR3]
MNNIQNYTVIKHEKDRLDSACASDFQKNVYSQVSSSHKTIILDLAKVTFIDSSGLGALVAVLKQLPSDGKLLLCGVGHNVFYLLRLTRMDNIFTLYPDLDSAVQTMNL